MGYRILLIAILWFAGFSSTAIAASACQIAQANAAFTANACSTQGGPICTMLPNLQSMAVNACRTAAGKADSGIPMPANLAPFATDDSALPSPSFNDPTTATGGSDNAGNQGGVSGPHECRYDPPTNVDPPYYDAIWPDGMITLGFGSEEECQAAIEYPDRVPKQKAAPVTVPPSPPKSQTSVASTKSSPAVPAAPRPLSQSGPCQGAECGQDPANYEPGSEAFAKASCSAKDDSGQPFYIGGSFSDCVTDNMRINGKTQVAQIGSQFGAMEKSPPPGAKSSRAQGGGETTKQGRGCYRGWEAQVQCSLKPDGNYIDGTPETRPYCTNALPEDVQVIMQTRDGKAHKEILYKTSPDGWVWLHYDLHDDDVVVTSVQPLMCYGRGGQPNRMAGE